MSQAAGCRAVPGRRAHLRQDRHRVRGDRRVLANRELPADDEKTGIETAQRTEGVKVHWARHTACGCILAGQYCGADWAGEAATFGTANGL